MLTLLVLLQTQSPLAARADTIRPVHDALHYDITLVPSDTGNHVLAEVQTTWRLRSAEPVGMELDSAMRVVRVLVDGKPNTRLSRTLYARSEGEVEVPHQKPAGDTLTTRVRYHGQVRDGLIIGANQYGARTIFADNWPDRAHLWLASQDHPSDKATVAFHVQASVNDQVIANGVLEKIDTLAYGNAVWHYRMDRPIPVYTMVVGIGRMARTRLPDAECRQSCVPVTVWTYREDSAYALKDPFRRAAEILRYYSGLVGPFPYGSLAHVESSTRFGGMENSTAIFYDEKRYRQQNLGEPVVAHETAHQWFGDAVTEGDWHHLWLSEGFATYLAALWRAHADGDSAFRAGMRQMADQVFESKEVGQPILDTTATDLLGLLNSNNYQKGAWVLHQLRGVVGDSAFFSGLRRYYSTFRDSTALSADFARIMSEAAGRDLDWYFRQALTQPGYPVLDLKWTHKGKKLTVDITQTQPAEWGEFQIPSLILLVDDIPVRLHVGGRQSRQVVEGIPRKPKRIQVDPNGWWLLKTTVNRER
jgi:aminopeptidase N